jgi:hypothetical protein
MICGRIYTELYHRNYSADSLLMYFCTIHSTLAHSLLKTS